MAFTFDPTKYPFRLRQLDIEAMKGIVAIVDARESRCPHLPNSLTPYWAQEDWIKCRAKELAERTVLITNVGDSDADH